MVPRPEAGHTTTPTRGKPWLPRGTAEVLDKARGTDNFVLAMRRFVGPDHNGQFKQKHQADVLNYLAGLSRTLSAEGTGTVVLGAVKACGERTRKLAETCRLQIERSPRVAWRMVTGLGGASVLEGSGMTLHPLYGFPYVPGSSVKGLCRAVALAETFEAHREVLEGIKTPRKSALEILNERMDRGDYARGAVADGTDPAVWDALSRISRVFGSLAGQGGWVFFDAVPQTFPALEVDIVNVHYPKYYQGDEAPGDWQDPSPVYFLTVPCGTPFTFIVGGRRDACAGDLEYIERWLETGLAEWGVGAKKSAGYGAFDLT